MLRIMSHPIQILSKLIGGNMNFTREESKIGMWGDKPLYCKMLSGDSISTGIYPDENNGNYEAVIGQFGWVIENNGYKHAFGIGYANNYCHIGLDNIEKNSLRAWNSFANKYEIVILYTKVVD